MSITFAMLKQKKVYIPGIIALLIGYILIHRYQVAHAPIAYDTVTVTRGNLEQHIEATGKLNSVNDIGLRFEVPGTLQKITVREGQTVHAGAILASLRLADLNASVAQASANLQQKLAGATEQDRSYYAAAVDAAKATLEQAQIDNNKNIIAAEATLATAENNLQLAAGGDSSHIVTQAYENAVASIQTSLGKIDDGLTQADNILGIDNGAANNDFEIFLAVQNPHLLDGAPVSYYQAKSAATKIREQARLITNTSNHAAIDNALPATETALLSVGQTLSLVSSILDATPVGGSLTQTALDTKKTTIATARAAVSAQLTAAIKVRQAITDAANSYITYKIAYDKAQQDLIQAKATAESNLTIKQAAYNQALSNYESKTVTPRDVDVAAYRAALAQAVAQRDKAIIKAPMDGVIVKINKKIGEQVSTVDPVIQILSPHYEIAVDIPETDIAKLNNGTDRSVDFTVDAFGEDQKFSGQVTSVDLKSTEIQDVVYYQVKIEVNPAITAVFSAGMTANVKIHTNSRQNALIIPLRLVHTRDDGSKFVRILENGQSKEQTVSIGLKGDENKVEILSGLTEGQQVIVGTQATK